MKFFPVMLLACMAGASSVFADLNELNDAEERHAAVFKCWGWSSKVLTNYAIFVEDGEEHWTNYTIRGEELIGSLDSQSGTQQHGSSGVPQGSGLGPVLFNIGTDSDKAQLDSSNNPNRLIESVASNERVRTSKQEVSLEDNSLDDVLLNKKLSSSESPEEESMRSLHHDNEIIQLEETVNEQSETSTKSSQNATTEGRLAKLGLKVGEEIDLMLTKIKNKMKNYFPLRS